MRNKKIDGSNISPGQDAKARYDKITLRAVSGSENSISALSSENQEDETIFSSSIFTWNETIFSSSFFYKFLQTMQAKTSKNRHRQRQTQTIGDRVFAVMEELSPVHRSVQAIILFECTKFLAKVGHLYTTRYLCCDRLTLGIKKRGSSFKCTIKIPKLCYMCSYRETVSYFC